MQSSSSSSSCQVGVDNHDEEKDSHYTKHGSLVWLAFKIDNRRFSYKGKALSSDSPS